MSYDIYLKEPISKVTIRLPVQHIIGGGIIRTDAGKSNSVPVSEAYLNITYNYSSYYYAAAENDERFLGYKDDNKVEKTNLGIRGIYGKTGAESIPMLRDLAKRIETANKTNGEWVENETPNSNYWKSTAANAVKPLYQLISMAQMRPDGIWDGD